MSEITLHESKQPALLPPKEEAIRHDNYKFAMWLYLASEVVLFAVLIGGFVLWRIQFPDMVKQLHDTLGVVLVSANTFLLLTSSWTMVMGLREIMRDNVPGLLRWFGITAILGVVFMVLQYVEYRELAHLGITLDFAGSASEYAGLGVRFYSATFFHGVHVFVGVIWCLLVMQRARRGAFSSKRYTGVEVFGLYWHFVDVVWIIIFTLFYLV
ncbi:MAG: cytochrome c oxidase subunit 3 [Anaerolineae bacterium]|jgi:heme/copper-type cytochrome/quinol oxidase subunit 3|nr:cytochrome c oxidase subunit 3 [Anaerolineae bacterium]